MNGNEQATPQKTKAVLLPQDVVDSLISQFFAYIAWRYGCSNTTLGARVFELLENGPPRIHVRKRQSLRENPLIEVWSLA